MIDLACGCTCRSETQIPPWCHDVDRICRRFDARVLDDHALVGYVSALCLSPRAS